MRITFINYLLLLPLSLLFISVLSTVAMFIFSPMAVSFLFFGGGYLLLLAWLLYGYHRDVFGPGVEIT
jgi:hypothetical protein